MSRKHLLAAVLGVVALLASLWLAHELLPSDSEPSITIESINGQSTADEEARLATLQEHCSGENAGDFSPRDIASRLDIAPVTLSDQLVYMLHGEVVTALNPQELLQCYYDGSEEGDRFASVSVTATSFDDGQAYWDEATDNPCEGGCESDLPSDHPNNVDDSFVVEDNYTTFINVKRERRDFDGPQSPVGTVMVVSTVQGDVGCSANFHTSDTQPESFTRLTNTLRDLVDQACQLASQAPANET